MAKKALNQNDKIALRDVVTHDGVFAVDAQQRIVHWNSSAERILGLRAEDVLGKACYELIGGKDSRNYRFCRRNCPVMVNAKRGRSTPDHDILCSTPTTDQKWLNMSVAIPKANHNDLWVFHLFRDVTDRRRTEEFARKAAGALRDLLNRENGEWVEDEVETSPTPFIKLSRRELEVLRLLATGVSTKEIANTLAIQPVTARNHITRILTKLGVENRLQAVVYASERRLI